WALPVGFACRWLLVRFHRRANLRSSLRLWAVFVGVCVVIAGCSHSKDDNAGSDVTAKRVTAVDKNAPLVGGTLEMALSGVDTLDPARANEASTSELLVLDML